MGIEEKIAVVANTPQRRQLFFSKLEDPKLLPALEAAGYFAAVPPPVEDPPGTLVHPIWPEGQYLMRIADKAPTDVARILARTKTHENIHAIRLRLEAFKRMPGQEIRSHLPLIRDDLSKEADEAGFHIVGIANQLWNAGLKDEAAELVQWAFRTQPPPREKAATSFRPRATLEATGFVSHEILKDFLLPHLADDPQRVIDIAANALREYLEAQHPGQPGPRRRDSSFIWQADLNKRDEYGHPQDQLLWLLREATKTAPDAAAAKVQIDRLEKKGWSAFRRVALALLADRVRELRAEAVTRILDAENHADYTIRPEYVQLVRALGPTLTQDEIKKFVAIAEAVLDPSKERELLRSYINREPTEEELEGVRARELRDRLAPLKDQLPVDVRQRFDKWVATYGEPVFVDSPVKIGPTLIGTQPEPAIENVPFPDLAERLHQILLQKTDRGRLEWGRDNLHDRVTELSLADLSTVLNDPGILDRFPRIFQPDVVRAVSQGTGQPVFLEAPFPDRVITFLEKTATLPDAQAKSDHGLLLNIQRILEAVIRHLPAETPQDMLDRVWNLIRSGVGAPYPYGVEATGDRDWFTDGINSAPGKAVENVVQFALHLIRAAGQENGPLTGPFAAEIQTLLREQVDLSKQSLLAVHAVTARFLPWIYSVDPDHIHEVIAMLLPGNDPQAEAWRAGWQPYVLFTKAYSGMWPLLRQQFHLLLGKPPTWLENDRETLEHTTWHMLAYFLAGQTDADDVTQLLASPSARLRRETLVRIGQGFLDDKEAGKPERIKRATDLADRLIDDVLAGADAAKILGAAAFLVSAKVLPLEWRLRVGHKVADAGIEFDEDHRLVETLVAAAEQRPADAWGLLARILQGWHKQGKGRAFWRVYSARDELMAALNKVDPGNVPVAKEAYRVAETLVAMNLLEFRGAARKLKK